MSAPLGDKEAYHQAATARDGATSPTHGFARLHPKGGHFASLEGRMLTLFFGCGVQRRTLGGLLLGAI
jgi:hypothetical protein